MIWPVKSGCGALRPWVSPFPACPPTRCHCVSLARADWATAITAANNPAERGRRPLCPGTEPEIVHKRLERAVRDGRQPREQQRNRQHCQPYHGGDDRCPAHRLRPRLPRVVVSTAVGHQCRPPPPEQHKGDNTGDGRHGHQVSEVTDAAQCPVGWHFGRSPGQRTCCDRSSHPQACATANSGADTRMNVTATPTSSERTPASRIPPSGRGSGCYRAGSALPASRARTPRRPAPGRCRLSPLATSAREAAI